MDAGGVGGVGEFSGPVGWGFAGFEGGEPVDVVGGVGLAHSFVGGVVHVLEFGGDDPLVRDVCFCILRHAFVEVEEGWEVVVQLGKLVPPFHAGVFDED